FCRRATPCSPLFPYTTLFRSSFLASVVLGLLAAAISFARYFPNRDEDLSKGKRTPVTILGAHRAKVIFVGILSLPVAVGIAWLPDRKSTRLNSSHVSISYAVF